MDRGSWHCTGDRDQDHPQGKEMQKSKMAVWGGLTNSCEKKRRKVKSLSHVWLSATPWTVAYQASPSMGFFRQEYWSGLAFPSPGDLPDPGIKSGSPALEADSLTSEPPGKRKAKEKRKDISVWMQSSKEYQEAIRKPSSAISAKK